MPVKGSCLCGGVAYEFSSDPIGIFHCHCSRCRKTRGVAHGANMLLPMEGFRFERGEELLARFKPADALRYTHVFCKTCGSTMPNVDTTRGFVILPMGSLDDTPPSCSAQHIYVGSKAAWERDIDDGLPRHEAEPPLSPFTKTVALG